MHKKFASLQTSDLFMLGIRATLTCHAKAPEVPASAVGPSGFGPAGSPTLRQRLGGGGPFPGIAVRRRWRVPVLAGLPSPVRRVGGPARLRPFRRGAPLSPCAGAAVRPGPSKLPRELLREPTAPGSLLNPGSEPAAGAAKPVFPPAPEAVVERSGCWFVRPPERRRGSLTQGAAVPGAVGVVSSDSTPLARGTGDSLPRAFAWPSRPRLMRRRVAPFQGTAQRVSSPCTRRLNFFTPGFIGRPMVLAPRPNTKER